MFADRATIFVCSGKGGDGHVSFRREKYIPKGGPSGGDGGDGGSITLVAKSGIDTLDNLVSRHHWRAGHGEAGRTKQRHGVSQLDLEVPVPLGTLVYDEATGQLLADLDEPGKRLVAARGGRGGYGNEHFKSATNQAPTQWTPGEPSVERTLRLELKLIADLGLIGMPNAGKSTMLAAISAARPKIATYPFTTLEPHLGVTELPDHRRLVVADIPGLIEGASQGLGLGAQFLRHVERTRLLVHLVDIDPMDGSDPVTNYRSVRKELRHYSQTLADKPQLVALNKIDLLPDSGDQRAAAELIEQAIGQHVFTVSGVARLGIERLLEACWRRVRRM